MKDIIITQENIDAIIAKEMEGSASVQEIEALKKWILISQDNRIYYNQIHEVDGFFTNSNSEKVDVDAAWNKVKTNIIPAQKVQKDSIFRSINFSPNLAYAASIAVIISAAIWIFKVNSNQVEYVVSNEVAIEQKLDDGTVIKLEKNSALSQLKKDRREYKFSGKAEFKVEHNEEDPFIIHINNIKVEDIGTVFHINAVPSSDTVEVKVNEGKVQFYTQDNKGLLLIEGEEGIYVKSKDKFYKRAIDAAKQILSVSFQDAALSDVLDNLSYSFRKEIKLENDALKNCNITVDFTGADYPLVKEIIEETLNIHIEQRNNTLYIKGESCN